MNDLEAGGKSGPVRTRGVVEFVVVVMVATTACAAVQHDRGGEAPFGHARGLDHVGIVVTDVDTAATTYEGLGFARGPAHRTNGIRNRTIFFRDRTYLELLTVDDRALATRLSTQVAARLERGEGGIFAGLAVASARDAAAFLRVRGVRVAGPTSGTAEIEGIDEVPAELFRFVLLEDSVAPANAVFFLEYVEDALRPLRRRHERQSPLQRADHPNTALGIHAVWMAVDDLPRAEAVCLSMGLTRTRMTGSSWLGARGVELEAGAGRILLLAPDASDGSVLARHLRVSGAGVAGVSIEVASLRAAAATLGATAVAVPSGFYGESLLIPPERAHGVWIELFEARRPPR